MPEKKKPARNFESTTGAALSGIQIVPAAKHQAETGKRRSPGAQETQPAETPAGEEMLVSKLIDFIKGL